MTEQTETAGTSAVASAETASFTETVLATKGLTIAFGGHKAVQDVDLEVKEKSFTSIIGPNGAGKTTLFNLLSGQLKPSFGSIYFKGQDVTRMAPYERTRLGMGRSFQITNVFPNLSVLENVRLAVQSRAGVRYNFFSSLHRYRKLEEEALGLLELVRLGGKAGALAVQLAHGEKRKLEIAMLLALRAELLLLDEPTAGISVEEVPQILEVIRALKQEGSRTIILIEHKMEMVLDLSDSIAVLFNGSLLASGPPADIMNNETVQAAYLGGLYDDAAAVGIG
ncbi:ABC transporter ATP-binding protein [Paenibacillus donghaensis]|jgi:branched-chain amino acid transport system ATP-binding protein|uniref:ABC transporter ATP-binding protein n=1 Tax=Paenibacillus donghaensis TaxID=414771 RepID=UPI00188397C8|nr:ABC transporter ATP-binding protein [Paenibacillus donghaensis]MBE9914442.1 ABC transporter ATP-binding protein [Paenibacillus donghaensis]